MPDARELAELADRVNALADSLQKRIGVLVQNNNEQQAVLASMAEGVLARSGADVAVAVTGVAGPGGGTAAKPVGLVHFAAARRGGGTLHRECRFGDIGRSEVRLASVREALQLVSRTAR